MKDELDEEMEGLDGFGPGSRRGAGAGAGGSSAEGSENESESEHKKELFQLFAVINHHGRMDNGHYTCFVRQMGDLWVKCDDAWITRASLKNVLASNGYLLFYVRKYLEYERT